jgi:hypothetical protein
MKIKTTDLREYFPTTLLRARVNSYTVVYNFMVLNPNTTFKIKFGVLFLRKIIPILHMFYPTYRKQSKVKVLVLHVAARHEAVWKCSGMCARHINFNIRSNCCA